jgi:hypothetical protein
MRLMELVASQAEVNANSWRFSLKRCIR